MIQFCLQHDTVIRKRLKFLTYISTNITEERSYHKRGARKKLSQTCSMGLIINRKNDALYSIVFLI
jgi:hypothetical protein